MKAPHPSEEEIFTAAARLCHPDERAAYLKHACGGDDQLRQSIEALLGASENSGDLLNQPPTAVLKTFLVNTSMLAVTEKPGDKIGRYKLREQIRIMAHQNHNPMTPSNRKRKANPLSAGRVMSFIRGADHDPALKLNSGK